MTLNEILAIQKVLTNRNLPSDILDYAEQQRVSESTGKTQVIGECDIVHVLRILLKENRNAKNKSNKSKISTSTHFKINRNKGVKY